MEITRTVIFVKCCDFAKICFAMFFCQNAVILRLLQEFLVFNHHKLKFILLF